MIQMLQHQSAAVQKSNRATDIKKIHLIKEAMEIKKMTISRFYLHSENDNIPFSISVSSSSSSSVSSLSPAEGPLCYIGPALHVVSIGLHFMFASVCVHVCVCEWCAALKAVMQETKLSEAAVLKMATPAGQIQHYNI